MLRASSTVVPIAALKQVFAPNTMHSKEFAAMGSITILHDTKLSQEDLSCENMMVHNVYCLAPAILTQGLAVGLNSSAVTADTNQKLHLFVSFPSSFFSKQCARPCNDASFQ